MRIFIGGVMQASITGKGIVSQDYRRQIAEALLARWPEVEIVDPFEQHPTSVEYDDARAKETLFASLAYAAASDLLIAYVPTASMGTALEMYVAHRARRAGSDDLAAGGELGGAGAVAAGVSGSGRIPGRGRGSGDAGADRAVTCGLRVGDGRQSQIDSPR